MIRHETEEEFFDRMKDLAQRVDRGEKVVAEESISFQDLEEYLLTGLGTFCTSDCVSSEDLCKLLKEKDGDN
jgi:hypothetical protein